MYQSHYLCVFWSFLMSVYHWAYRMFLALCRPLFILVSIYPYLTVWVWNPISSHVCLFYPSLPLSLSSHASLYHYVSLGPYLSFRLSASISLYGFISSSVMAASKHHLILYNSGENKQKARWQWAKTTVIFGYQGFQAHSNIQIALIFFWICCFHYHYSFYRCRYPPPHHHHHLLYHYPYLIIFIIISLQSL